MTSFFRFFSLFILTAALLGGCMSNPHPEGKPLARLTFDHIEPLALNVGSIEIEDRYRDLGQAADMSAGYVMPPGETVQRYLNARFKPQGVDGTLQAIIEEASVSYYKTPSKNRFGRWFNLAGFDEYKITVKLHLMSSDAPGYRRLGKRMTAKRRVQVSEHASLAEREKKQMEALEALLHDIDEVVTRTVIDDFGLVLAP